MAEDNLFPTIGAVVDQTSHIGSHDGQAHPPLDTSEELEFERPIQEVDSLCMECSEQGTTRLLLTSIPYFREVVLMSFRCQHCGAANNEIQSAGAIQPLGTIHTTRILSSSDLNRQLIRAPTCTVRIPEFDLTLPPMHDAQGGGYLTTVEGLLRAIVKDLGMGQAERQVENMAAWEAIEPLLAGLKAILAQEADAAKEPVEGKHEDPLQITIILDDPAGNSFIEFVGSMADPQWHLQTYSRTKKDEVELGLAPEAEEDMGEGDEENEDVAAFPGHCSNCGHPVETRMKKVVIPYFKDILIMSTNCDQCGYRDNEIKSGSAISPQGKRIILKVEDREDLSRDILKSDSASLKIPEIDLALESGTLGGRFTTVEGILQQVYDELSQNVTVGDSKVIDDSGRVAFDSFLQRLKDVISASNPFTLVLDDPLSNSYIQSLYAPDPDPSITIELYERSWEQNEELGLNDMKVEGYEEKVEKQL